jgi:Flp pilus assembly protein TadB
MPNDQQNIIAIFASIAAFGLVLSLWLMAVLMWSDRRKRRASALQKRLDYVRDAGAAAKGRVLRLWHDGKEETTVVPGMTPTGIRVRLNRYCAAAGVVTPLATAIPMLGGILVLVIGIGYIITSNLVIGLLCGVCMCVIVSIRMSQRINKRTSIFERQFVDALELAAGRFARDIR